MFLFQSIGMPAQYNAIQPIINIILPIGISFYTFHGISYVLDIYFKRIIPTKSFSEYALFVCFFPLLIAGPIERANHLLPQLKCLKYSKNAINHRLISIEVRKKLTDDWKKGD